MDQPAGPLAMQILDQLGSGEGMPIEAIHAATADRANVTPLLLDAIDRYDPKNEQEDNALFIAFHLLGQWREKSAYRVLARFLRRPDIETVLGDATTVTCHKVMANVFDGDPQPIYDIIHDSEADEFVRSRMFDALVMLVFQGELDRAEVAQFVRSAFADLQPQGPSVVWDGWQGAVALLALAEMEPLVRQVFQRGFIDTTLVPFKDFEGDLKRACAGRPVEAWRRNEFQPFGDVVAELSHWDGFQPKKQRTADHQPLPAWPDTPVRNPFRDVGRNDPCPCGSGKKFKKCCLGKPPAELQPVMASDDPFDAEDLEAFEDAGLIGEYDPFVEPDADEWLAADEQSRIDATLDYHRREGFKVERLEAHAIIHVVVETQIALGDELPVRRTLQRLMAEGLDRHDALHAIGAVLAGHLNELLRKADLGDGKADADSNDAYFSELERLTAKSWRQSG
ncbi:DUF1186 domain-containing protein [Bradyrhizobium lablabi]|uniref:DUF1186 domain-containing protein n=1 Tax=Bradyrhizobium lablabi TaxID=722472 RepID=UPI001BA802B5|nr:DUF1186 domain-containing protein [Bradyrhizobium lablabi]MBR1126454.1 DUF1186 domain-containing protein [Bradyrhizobium lablabi]